MLQQAAIFQDSLIPTFSISYSFFAKTLEWFSILGWKFLIVSIIFVASKKTDLCKKYFQFCIPKFMYWPRSHNYFYHY